MLLALLLSVVVIPSNDRTAGTLAILAVPAALAIVALLLGHSRPLGTVVRVAATVVLFGLAILSLPSVGVIFIPAALGMLIVTVVRR